MKLPQTSLNWMMSKNRFLWPLRPTMPWNNNPGPFTSSLIRKKNPSKMKRYWTLMSKQRSTNKSKRLKMLRNKPFANSTLWITIWNRPYVNHSKTSPQDLKIRRLKKNLRRNLNNQSLIFPWLLQLILRHLSERSTQPCKRWTLLPNKRGCLVSTILS